MYPYASRGQNTACEAVKVWAEANMVRKHIIQKEPGLTLENKGGKSMREGVFMHLLKEAVSTGKCLSSSFFLFLIFILLIFETPLSPERKQ